jgi:hypothetical protein
MSKENEMFEYDDSVKFIQNHLPEEMKNEFSDDDIIYIVDLVDEFFEKKGFFNDGNEEYVDICEDELCQYAIKNANKGGVRKYTDAQIEAIIAAEMAYCESQNIFDTE